MHNQVHTHTEDAMQNPPVKVSYAPCSLTSQEMMVGELDKQGGLSHSRVAMRRKVQRHRVVSQPPRATLLPMCEGGRMGGRKGRR